MPLIDKRLEALRKISKGPVSVKDDCALFVVMEPNTGTCLGVFDSEEKADELMAVLVWDRTHEYYSPDAYIETVFLNRDVFGILKKTA